MDSRWQVNLRTYRVLTALPFRIILSAIILAAALPGISAAEIKTIKIRLPATTSAFFDTGLNIKKGTTASISATGDATCHAGGATDCPIGPDGAGILCANNPFFSNETPGPAGPDVPYGAAAGRVGNGKPFYIGAGPVSAPAGELFLVYNDCVAPAGYADNAGSLVVSVRGDFGKEDPKLSADNSTKSLPFSVSNNFPGDRIKYAGEGWDKKGGKIQVFYGKELLKSFPANATFSGAFTLPGMLTQECGGQLIAKQGSTTRTQNGRAVVMETVEFVDGKVVAVPSPIRGSDVGFPATNQKAVRELERGGDICDHDNIYVPDGSALVAKATEHNTQYTDLRIENNETDISISNVSAFAKLTMTLSGGRTYNHAALRKGDLTGEIDQILGGDVAVHIDSTISDAEQTYGGIVTTKSSSLSLFGTVIPDTVRFVIPANLFIDRYSEVGGRRAQALYGKGLSMLVGGTITINGPIEMNRVVLPSATQKAGRSIILLGDACKVRSSHPFCKQLLAGH